MNDLIAILPTCAIGRRSAPEIVQMLHDAASDSDPGNMFMRMFYLSLALGQDELAAQMQTLALGHRSVFRVAGPPEPKIKLLAFVGPGNMQDNIPIDYLVDQSDIQVDLLFVLPDHDLPDSIPDHDVALVALGESDKNNPILKKIEKLLASWPRPYINAPEKVLNCARHKIPQILQNIPGLVVPKTYRLHREQLAGLTTFPVTVRPIDTHAGKGLEKVNFPDELKSYLERDSENDEFYISEFIDYQSRDGCYRKFRIALIDRKPFICHLAISENWMVHYLSSGMELSERKRMEEKAAMENFDRDFAVNHREALSAIACRLGLDYVVIDCAETKNGELLLFEADPRGWIHAIDPVEVFPYKPAVMQKAFDAFRSLLQRAGVLLHPR